MPIRSAVPLGSARYPTLDMSHQFEEFINEFDRAFSLPRFATSEPSMDFSPALDFEERGDSYLVTVDLPGLRKEDIHLDLREGVLTISGERLQEASGEERYRERPFGNFSRSLALPSQVDESKIDAHFVAGVLNVTLPKQAGSKSHSIKIL